MPRAATAEASSPRSAPASAPRSALCPAHFSSSVETRFCECRPGSAAILAAFSNEPARMPALQAAGECGSLLPLFFLPSRKTLPRFTRTRRKSTHAQPIHRDPKKSGGKPPLSKRNSMPTHWYGVLTALFTGGVQFALFLRWLHRRMRNDEITRAFVRDIATNHLPHIYNALQKIAAEQGIELDETPLVRFVDLHGRHRNK